MIGAQEKKIRRIMIAAPKSGSGKTMITCGLLQIFKENGEDISSCKCGPDYIDRMSRGLGDVYKRQACF